MILYGTTEDRLLSYGSYKLKLSQGERQRKGNFVQMCKSIDLDLVELSVLGGLDPYLIVKLHYLQY